MFRFLDALEEEVDPDWRWLCLGMAKDCTASEALGMGSVLLFDTTVFVASVLHYIVVTGNRNRRNNHNNYNDNDNRYFRHSGAATATTTSGTTHEASPIVTPTPSSSTRLPPTRHTTRRSNKKNVPENGDELLALCGLMVYFFVFCAGCLLWALKGEPAVHPFRNSVVQLIGSVLLLLCSCGYVVVHADLGNNWSPFPERLDDHQLVTTGLFSWARHPLYAVVLWATIGTLLATLNWLFAWVLAGFCGMVLLRIPKEEAILLDLFGDEYRDYQASVPALGWPWS